LDSLSISSLARTSCSRSPVPSWQTLGGHSPGLGSAGGSLILVMTSWIVRVFTEMMYFRIRRRPNNGIILTIQKLFSSRINRVHSCRLIPRWCKAVSNRRSQGLICETVQRLPWLRCKRAWSCSFSSVGGRGWCLSSLRIWARSSLLDCTGFLMTNKATLTRESKISNSWQM
jgi:hypothetical protein